VVFVLATARIRQRVLPTILSPVPALAFSPAHARLAALAGALALHRRSRSRSGITREACRCGATAPGRA